MHARNDDGWPVVVCLKTDWGLTISHRTPLTMGEDRGPVARTDFKSDETRQTRLVGSTPTLVRQSVSTH